MASIAERAAKLERRLAERERKIEIILPAWLTTGELPTPAPSAADAVERRCADAGCGAVLTPSAKFCHQCAAPVERTR